MFKLQKYDVQPKIKMTKPKKNKTTPLKTSDLEISIIIFKT